MKPGSTVDKLVTAAILFAGLGAIGFGLWQVYAPAAWIFGGAVAVLAASDPLGARAKAASKP